MNQFERERNLLHTNLLDAVRACQTHLVGKQRLVTGDTSWISCLCSQFEAVLQHKMKPPTRGLASLTYLSKSEEVTFWNLVKQHLSNHEIERFSNLQNVKTDVGRGRAWLRCSLNEGSLKRYLQMLLGDTTLLKKYYETEAFLLDEELASTLPHMAAGLTSLFFNISYDNASLDGSTVAQSPSLPALLNAAATTLTSKTSHHTDNKSFEEATFPKTVTTRVGKKKRSKIISFSDDDESDCSATLSQASEDAPGSSKSDQVLLHSSSSSKTLKKNGHSPQNESKTSLYDKSSPLKQKDAASYQEHSDVEDTSSTSDGHDVIMDELIIRTPSSSTSGLLFPAENETVTLLPVQYDDDDDDDDDVSPYSTIASDLHQSVDIDNASLHGKARNKSSQMTLEKDQVGSYSMDELKGMLDEITQEKEEVINSNKRLKTLLNLQMDQSLVLQQKVQDLQTQLLEKTEQERLLRVEFEKVTKHLKDSAKQPEQKDFSQDNASVAGESIICDQADNQSILNESKLYEQKLVEVSQMHGELLELNSNLRIRLRSAIILLKIMKEELVALRGPMLHDALVSKIENDTFNSSDPEISSARALINVWIPSVYFQKKGSSSHHVYQVFVRIGSEEWNIYRRYSDFFNLHRQVRKKHPIVDTFSFPPKKAVGNKSTKFVEQRRKQLQMYLRLLLNNVVQSDERLVSNPQKTTLMALLPFFNESSS